MGLCYGLDGQGFKYDFSFLQNVHTSCGTYPAPYSMGTEVNQSSPFSANVEIEWTYASAHCVCLMGVEGAGFTFMLFNLSV